MTSHNAHTVADSGEASSESASRVAPRKRPRESSSDRSRSPKHRRREPLLDSVPGGAFEDGDTVRVLSGTHEGAVGVVSWMELSGDLGVSHPNGAEHVCNPHILECALVGVFLWLPASLTCIQSFVVKMSHTHCRVCQMGALP